ncbi:MAG TPA: oligopeptide/dipeptide ABC transporter ATP-binding protein [Ramlibacter sp.]|nr:oligopeptide/dipeptide ABC transporter ATP-binding protein [Ramlibacter sp.]
MIAMALANEPDLLIADEPTTALDVTIQAQILELLKDIQQRFGIIGESGSGKTLTALAVTGLLPEGAEMAGSVTLDGEPLPRSERAMARLRGKRIGMVFQEPMTALNPVHTVGRQVAEPLRLHRGLSAADARKEAVALLDRVGIPDAARRLDAYPHQFSGGQRQRITIAMALACGPDLLIADEPTTALDVTIQRQILDLIRELVAERGMALMLISHDLGVIAQNVQRMLVMYGGTMVESGATAQVFGNRMHPYTLGLFAARPGLRAARGRRLTTIPGTVPELVDLPKGCPFAGRCAWTIPECNAQMPPPFEVEAGHHARCIRLDVVAAERDAVAPALTPTLSQGEREKARS